MFDSSSFLFLLRGCKILSDLFWRSCILRVNCAWKRLGLWWDWNQVLTRQNCTKRTFFHWAIRPRQCFIYSIGISLWGIYFVTFPFYFPAQFSKEVTLSLYFPAKFSREITLWKHFHTSKKVKAYQIFYKNIFDISGIESSVIWVGIEPSAFLSPFSCDAKMKKFNMCWF